MYYAMLGAVASPPVSHECDPYTMPRNDHADQDLSSALVLVSRNAANVNVCEELL